MYFHSEHTLEVNLQNKTNNPFLINLLSWSMGLALLALLLSVRPALAEGQKQASVPLENGSSSATLCLPGIYLVDPEDCLVEGPSAYLTDMATHHIFFPIQPLAATKPDPSLVGYPFLYARLKENAEVPLYNSMEDAVEGIHPVGNIEAGKLRYVSYVQDFIVRPGRTKPDVFLLKTGEYVAARDIAQRENAVSQFQGLTFTETPKQTFGWVLPIHTTNKTKRTPGYATNDYNTRELTEYDVVQVYDTQEVDGADWYQVGPEAWIEGRFVGRVIPNPVPPQGVTNGRWIEVNLFDQTLSVYDQNKMVFATLIASGVKPFYTRPGLFPIQQKLDSTLMRGAFEADRSDFYYLEDVPWTMYYDQARALHGAYWRTRFGIAQSHGCVNLSPGDAHWLFNWAQEGDWVYVWDPSGETPTDPAAYGEGGA
jgi:hypothetical protein